MAVFNKPTKLENVWASVGVKTPNPDDSKIATGWLEEIPPREFFNYIEYKQDQMLAHINQRGIAEWDTSTSYLAGKSFAQGSNGIIYKSKTTHSGVDPVTEFMATTAAGGTNWKVAFYQASDLYTKYETDSKYAYKASNLSDLTNTANARFNLSVYSKGETDAYYLVKTSNLSDVANTAASRTNLSVYSKSETDAAYAVRSNNLTDLASTSIAFNNIKQAATDSYSGVAAFASDAEVDAGAVADKGIAPSKLKLGFSVNLGIIGHIRFPAWLSGFTVQWGTQFINANTTLNVTKSLTFTTALAAVASPSNSGGGDIACPHAYTSGGNVFVVNTDNNAYGFTWFAVGY